MATLIRFVGLSRDPDSGQSEGVFGVAYALLRSGVLPEDAESWLRRVLDGFEEHLPMPRRRDLHPRAIFWFKSWARRPTRRIWELVIILREFDRPVKLVKTRKPGYVLYEDRLQVEAIPFRDTLAAR